MPASAISGSVDDRRHAAGDQRNGDRRGGEAAEHQRALAADHDEAERAGSANASAGEDQRRGALQRVLERERRAEAAGPDQLEELDRRSCRRRAGTARRSAPTRSARRSGSRRLRRSAGPQIGGARRTGIGGVGGHLRLIAGSRPLDRPLRLRATSCDAHADRPRHRRAGAASSGRGATHRASIR